MKTNKKSVLSVVLLVVGGLIILIAAIYLGLQSFYYKKLENIKMMDTTNWKTYTDSRNGVSFKYPENISDPQIEENKNAYFQAENSFFSLSFFPDIPFSLEEWERDVGAEVTKSYTKVGDNLKGLVAYTPITNHQVYVPVHSDRIMIINSSLDFEVLQQILSTFTFTEPTWKTYLNKDLDFSFYYPKEYKLESLENNSNFLILNKENSEDYISINYYDTQTCEADSYTYTFDRSTLNWKIAEKGEDGEIVSESVVPASYSSNQLPKIQLGSSSVAVVISNSENKYLVVSNKFLDSSDLPDSEGVSLMQEIADTVQIYYYFF